MPVLSANAKRVVDRAVGLIPSDQERAVWNQWAAKTYTGAVPHAIHAIAVTALDRRLSEIERQRDTASEEDQSHLDNDVSFIAAIKLTLAS